VIQQGECVLEKNLVKDLVNPFDKTKPLIKNIESKYLAVLGKNFSHIERTLFFIKI